MSLCDALVRYAQGALQELEEILDDDADMADMYLTRRAAEEHAEALNAQSLLDDLAPGGNGFPTDGSARHVSL